MQSITRVAVIVTCALLSVWAGSQIVANRGPQRARRPPVETLKAGTLRIATAAAPVLGTASARMAIVEFADFECPFCGEHARDAFQAIEKNYVSTGKLRYIFRHLPLKHRHPYAVAASVAAECGHQEDKFWQMHSILFANQRALAREDLLRYAATAGLDPKRYQQCLEAGLPSALARDEDEARRLKVTATPTFFVGPIDGDGVVDARRRINGAGGYPEFESVMKDIGL